MSKKPTLNDKLYDAALEAINRLYSDTSVSRFKAAQNLSTLRGEIDILLDTLRRV